jgi:hypothetical protein
VSYILNVKKGAAIPIESELRVFLSKDGSMRAVNGNQVIISDWVSSIHALNQIINKVDQKGMGKKRKKGKR